MILQTKLIKSSYFILCGFVFEHFIRFLSGIIIARILGPSKYGVFSLCRNILYILSLVTRIGLDLGIVKLIHHENDKNSVNIIILQIIFFILFISLFFVIVTQFCLANFLEKYILKHKDLASSLKILIFALPFLTLMQVLRGVFRGYLQFFPIIFSEKILQPTLRLLFVLSFFLFFRLQLKGVLYATVLSFVFAATYLFLIFLKKFFCVNFLKKICYNFLNLKKFLDLYKFSFIIFLTGSVIFLLQRMDLLMIGFYLNSEEVGKYSVLQLIVPIIGLFSNTLNQTIAPLIANAWAHNDFLKIKKIMFQHIKWIFILTLPFLWVFSIWGKEIMLIFGSDYEVKLSVIRVLAFTYFLLSVFSSTGFVLSMTNKHVVEFICMSTALVLNFFLNLILIPIYGLLGASLATFFSILFSLSLKIFQIYRIYKIHIFQKEMGYLIIVAFISFILNILIYQFYNDIFLSYIFKIIISFLIFIITYILILIFSPFRNDMFFLFLSIRNKHHVVNKL